MSHDWPPSLLGATQRIVEIVENPCDAPWWVYVRTAVPALAENLYMLVIPSPQEIVEEYFDPSSTRSRAKRGVIGGYRRLRFPDGGHGRGRSGGFPDPDGLVAHYLPGRATFASRRIDALEHLFWTGLNIADEVAFYWMLYDASKSFIYDWHSGIIESSCTSRDYDAKVYYSRPAGASPAISQNPGWEPYWTRHYAEGITLIDAGDFELDRTMAGNVNWTQTFENLTPDQTIDVFSQIELRNPTDGQFFLQTKESSVGPGEVDTHNWHVQANEVRRVVARSTTTLGSVMNQYGDFSFLYQAFPG